MGKRDVEDMYRELEVLMSWEENGIFPSRIARENHHLKIQVLSSILQQEILKNKPESGKEDLSFAVEALDERITSLTFFEGNISDWVSDTSHLLTRIFGESHHSIKDISRSLRSKGYGEYDSSRLASSIYRHNEWKQLQQRLIEILKICRKELEIMSAQSSGNLSFNLNEAFGYVSETRIQELKAIKSNRIDLTKLIRLCEELNIADANEMNLATAMLIRSILDHVPPIFSKPSFKEVASGYGGKSFKDTMQHLESGARKIADSHLHFQVRKKEILPTSLQVDFSQYLDVLLGEAIVILQSEQISID